LYPEASNDGREPSNFNHLVEFNETYRIIQKYIINILETYVAI